MTAAAGRTMMPVAMQKPHGLKFSESLSGYLGDGSDYWEAYEAGRAAGLHARFRVSVSIPDLGAFLADPEHVAGLRGWVAISGLGASLSVEDGRLHMFCPRGDETRLLYHLPFTLADERFLLWGEKRLTPARGRDAWGQMTTLYSELVRQEDGRDSLLRRGVLRIGPAGVAAQAASFRPQGSSSPWRFLLDWARFLRFSSRAMRGARVRRRCGGSRGPAGSG